MPLRVLASGFGIDRFCDLLLVRPLKACARFFAVIIDPRLIDGAVNGTGSFVNGASAILRRLQTGSMRAYALSVFVGVVLILGYYVWR